MRRDSLILWERRWDGFPVLFYEAAGILLSETVRQPVMQVPGLVAAGGHHCQVRLGPAPGQIKKIGFEDGGFKDALILADGGHHKFPPGGPVFYLIE